MLRHTINKCYSKSILNRCHRHQSTSSSKSGGGFGKTVVIGVLGTAAATGAVVAYAKQDNKFRTRIEEAVPYSDKVLNTVIGPSKELRPVVNVRPTVASPSTTSGKKSEEPAPSLLAKKLEREKTSAENNKPSPQESSSRPSLPPVPAPVLETTSVSQNKEDKKQPSNESGKAPLKEESSSRKEDAQEAGVNKKSGISPEWSLKDISKTTPKTSESKTSSSVDLAQLPPEVQEKQRQELIEQLKIQLSAYNDYLREQLQLQGDELQRIHLVALEEKVLEEKMKYQRELASSILRLQEVENVLKVRRRLDREEKSLKQLWFLCQHLNECLKSNPAEGIENDPKKLVTKEILPVLERIVKDDDASSLVHLAVQSIHDNQDLKERGVYTEDALICRFDHVDKVCRRVSLIGDEGGSLWRYLLSYMQSVFILDSARIPNEELNDQPLDTDRLDTFQVLSRVRHHLKNRNLEMSLRYANQLRGEPRRAAMDWIRDVRTHLEVKQAATLIQTHASCVSLKTFDTSS